MLRENDGRGVTRVGVAAGLWSGRWVANFRKFRKTDTARFPQFGCRPLLKTILLGGALLVAVGRQGLAISAEQSLEIALTNVQPKGVGEIVLLHPKRKGGNAFGAHTRVSAGLIRCLDEKGRLLHEIDTSSSNHQRNGRYGASPNAGGSHLLVVDFLTELPPASFSVDGWRLSVYDLDCKKIWQQENPTERYYYLSPDGNAVAGFGRLGSEATAPPVIYTRQGRRPTRVSEKADWRISGISDAAFSLNADAMAISAGAKDGDGGVILFSKTGDEKWRFSLPNARGLRFPNNAVLLAQGKTGNTLGTIALDADSGKALWSDEGVYFLATTRNNQTGIFRFLPGGTNKSWLQERNLKSGKVLWQHEFPRSRIFAGGASPDGRFLVVTSTRKSLEAAADELTILERSSMRQTTLEFPKDSVDQSPLLYFGMAPFQFLSDSKVLIGMSDGLRAYEIKAR